MIRGIFVAIYYLTRSSHIIETMWHKFRFVWAGFLWQIYVNYSYWPHISHFKYWHNSKHAQQELLALPEYLMSHQLLIGDSFFSIFSFMLSFLYIIIYPFLFFFSCWLLKLGSTQVFRKVKLFILYQYNTNKTNQHRNKQRWFR